MVPHTAGVIKPLRNRGEMIPIPAISALTPPFLPSPRHSCLLYVIPAKAGIPHIKRALRAPS